MSSPAATSSFQSEARFYLLSLSVSRSLLFALSLSSLHSFRLCHCVFVHFWWSASAHSFSLPLQRYRFICMAPAPYAFFKCFTFVEPLSLSAAGSDASSATVSPPCLVIAIVDIVAVAVVVVVCLFIAIYLIFIALNFCCLSFCCRLLFLDCARLCFWCVAIFDFDLGISICIHFLVVVIIIVAAMLCVCASSLAIYSFPPHVFSLASNELLLEQFIINTFISPATPCSCDH